MSTVKTYQAKRHLKVGDRDVQPGHFVPEANDWGFQILASNLRVGNLEMVYVDDAVLEEALQTQLEEEAALRISRDADVVENGAALDQEELVPPTEPVDEESEEDDPDEEEEAEDESPEVSEDEPTDSPRPRLKKKGGKRNG